MQKDYPKSGPLILKDPRLSLFLPLWKTVASNLDLDDYYVIPLRHPYEVAASLKKRNKISKTRALLIWLNYLFDAEKYTRDLKRTFVKFPDWVENIEATMLKIERDLGTGLPNNNKNNVVK